MSRSFPFKRQRRRLLSLGAKVAFGSRLQSCGDEKDTEACSLQSFSCGLLLVGTPFGGWLKSGTPEFGWFELVGWLNQVAKGTTPRFWGLSVAPCVAPHPFRFPNRGGTPGRLVSPRKEGGEGLSWVAGWRKGGFYVRQPGLSWLFPQLTSGRVPFRTETSLVGGLVANAKKTTNGTQKMLLTRFLSSCEWTIFLHECTVCVSSTRSA